VPEQVVLPSVADFKGMSMSETHGWLQRFGAMKPSAQAITENIGYLERMSAIQPGTPEFATALKTLTDTSETRGALQAARRAYREYGMLDAQAQNPKQEFVRLSETDDHTCDSCWGKAGEIGTIVYHASIGLPGAASCYGGDYCRCELLPLD